MKKLTALFLAILLVLSISVSAGAITYYQFYRIYSSGFYAYSTTHTKQVTGADAQYEVFNVRRGSEIGTETTCELRIGTPSGTRAVVKYATVYDGAHGGMAYRTDGNYGQAGQSYKLGVNNPHSFKVYASGQWSPA